MPEELRGFLKKNKLSYVKDYEWLTDIPNNLTEKFEIYCLPFGKSVPELADEFYGGQNFKKIKEIHKSDSGGKFTALIFEREDKRIGVVIYKGFPHWVAVRKNDSYPLHAPV